MLGICFVVGIFYMHRATKKYYNVALKKGIDEDQLTWFAVFLWLYLFAPIMTMLIVPSNIIFNLILISSYIPGIVLSRKLSVALDKGYDYEKRAGREFDKVMMLGFAGIGLVCFNWIMFLFRTMDQTLKPT